MHEAGSRTQDNDNTISNKVGYMNKNDTKTSINQSSSQEKISIRGLFGACAGNLIESYDFFIYAYLAFYFARSFFPSDDHITQLISSAGVFALGFFMRPIGGWVFGWIADTRGRKRSMIISIFMMCGSSLVIGVIPTYTTIGIFAPATLILARMAQGLAMGAEYGTVATYISEVATKGRRGLFSSFQYATMTAAQLLGLLTVVVLQSLLSEDAMRDWGWRIPFFLGALGAVFVIYLRRTMAETAPLHARRVKQESSIREMLPHWRAILLVLTFTAGGSLYLYSFTIYMQKLLVVSAGFDKATATLIMTAALLVFIACQPIFGALSDRIGVRNSMLLYTFGASISAVPLLTAVSQAQTSAMAFTLVVAGILIVSFYTPISGLLKADMFPATVRARGVGVPFAVANAVFGGTAEYVALFLRYHGIDGVFFYYVAALAAIAFVATLIMPDLRKHGYLDGDGKIEENIGLRRQRKSKIVSSNAG